MWTRRRDSNPHDEGCNLAPDHFGHGVGWRASRDSNPDLRFWRPPSCRWTTDPQGVLVRRHGFEPRSRESESRVLPIERAPHRWLGALDSNQVPKIQSLVSCRLDERRMGGTAGAIRTPVLDRRKVALYRLSHASVVRPERIELPSAG